VSHNNNNFRSLNDFEGANIARPIFKCSQEGENSGVYLPC
jgi:hypothetical protein